MPTYEYECLTNGHRFDVKQSFADAALTTCEVCGEPVRKVFSAAGIVFKGSGYYVTDTRSGAGAGAKKTPEPATSGSSDSSGSSSSGTSSSSGSSDGKAASTSTSSSSD